MINWPLVAASLAVVVIFIGTCALVIWDEQRRLRWEQAKDRLKGYHYDA